MAKKQKEETTHTVPNTDLDNDLQFVRDGLVSEFGSDSIDTFSTISDWISTKSIVIDKILAAGRPNPCSLLPFGRQTELAGLAGVGKTTLCAQLTAQVQSMGGVVIMVDTEERLDDPYWRALGVDFNKILPIYAASIEDVFRKQIEAIKLMQKRAPERPLLMIWDSLGATATETLLESDDPMGGEAMNKDVRIIGHGMKVINQLIAKAKVAYVYTNHLYQDHQVKYGDPWKSPGGNKANNFATVRLRLTVAGKIKEKDALGEDQEIGKRIRIKTIKNSMGPMWIEREAILIGGRGFDNDYSVMEVAETLKHIKAGPWSTWTTPSGDEVKYQGWKGFLEKVTKHPEYPKLVEIVTNAL